MAGLTSLKAGSQTRLSVGRLILQQTKIGSYFASLLIELHDLRQLTSCTPVSLSVKWVKQSSFCTAIVDHVTGPLKVPSETNLQALIITSNMANANGRGGRHSWNRALS